MLVVIFLLVLALVALFTYFNGQYNEAYWKKRGVKFHNRNAFLGPLWDYVTGDRALFEIYGDLYKQYEKEPAVGVGSMFSPGLFIRDQENVSHILQTDFNSFYHRGLENFEGDILTESIVFLNGPKWKLMRQSMTPLFTGTKLKNMFYIMDKSAEDFVQYIKNHPERQRGNAYDSVANFCCAAISAAVFGIGNKSTFDSSFIKVARTATEPTLSFNLKISISSLSPWLKKLFRLKIFARFEDFFVGTMREVLEAREKENIKRHDFADIALSIQRNGTLRDESTGCEMEPTVGLLSAQAFFFFIAGVEPSATSLYSALVELGLNPNILKKVHEEIDEAFEKNDNKINHDIVQSMAYLDKVLSESLRKYPPIGFLTRLCVQDTMLPVGNIKVAKGTKVFLPTFQIHHDPKYYADPEKFDPERFDRDGPQPLSEPLFMPFGRGNRLCIGARFARLQVKTGLIHLLRNFSVKTINNDQMKFRKEFAAVKLANVDVQFRPRNIAH